MGLSLIYIMNIREDKNQIKQSIDIYLAKDNLGNYKIPIEKQRPIFLLGAPGIGKTAIMEQIADELGIAIVSYSMTHHTRQSALGLPFIVKCLKSLHLYTRQENQQESLKVSFS